MRLLSCGVAYYADPRSFNDPLDCAPTIKVDTDRESLEKLWFDMYSSKNGKDRAQKQIAENRYHSTQVGDYKSNPQAEKFYKELLARDVKSLVDEEMSAKGVFSLAERWDCPLMWSHYADNHRGFCIEYETIESDFSNIKAVNYKGVRSIKVSDIISWKLDSSDEAYKNLINTYFFSKSFEWRYEKEWRDVHDSKGEQSAPVRISGIYFGCRCDGAVQTCIIKLFEKIEINFYDIYSPIDSFKLKRRKFTGEDIAECRVQDPPLLTFISLSG